MNLLVVSAHSADFCSRAGGTIAKHVQMGDKVRIVSLSFGERSESGGLYVDGARPSLDEVRAIRREEATEAAAILGAEIKFLDWGDLSFDYDNEHQRIVAQEIRDFAPQQVLTHHGPDIRSVDHDITYKLVLRGCQLASPPGIELDGAPIRRPEVFCYEATLFLTELEGFNPDFYVDITDVIDIKTKALQAFHRAQAFLEPWYTNQAKLRGYQANRLSGNPDTVYAEAFERTSPWVGGCLPKMG